MSEEQLPGAPGLPVPDDKIKSEKQFANFAAELTDEEIMKTMQIVRVIQLKYRGKTNTSRNLEALRDEVLTRLMGIGIVAELDPTPVFHGEPPVLEIIGKVAGDPMHKYGFDHEKKYYEVNKANARNEDYLGQKEPTNKRKDKKRK